LRSLLAKHTCLDAQGLGQAVGIAGGGPTDNRCPSPLTDLQQCLSLLTEADAVCGVVALVRLGHHTVNVDGDAEVAVGVEAAVWDVDQQVR
jgi:hypothetical protein